MFPTDSEFTLLYFLYFSIFAYIIYQIIISKGANQIRLSLIIVLSLLIFYLKTENFEGGGSLVVVFYSAIIFTATTIITFINQIIYKKRINSKK